jgi:hypothetical protein
MFRESSIYLKTQDAYPDRVLVLYGRIKTSSIINYVQILSFTLLSVCKVSKINVKYVACASAKSDDQNSAKLRVCFIRIYVFAFAATFNTVFFAFFLQTRRLSRTSFSLQHFLLTINFLCKS